MKLKWIFALCLASTLFAGCVSDLSDHKQFAWDAGAGKDTVEGRYEFTPAQLWTATKDVIKTQGVLVSEDMQKNVLEASIDERKVWVHIQEFDTRTTRVLVQARSKGGADLEMAAFIDKQIAVRLATGNLAPSGAVKH